MTVERLKWYNKMLDVDRVIPVDEMETMRWNRSSEGEGVGGVLQKPTVDKPANLVSSLCDDGMHRPIFDFDFSIPEHVMLHWIETHLEWDTSKIMLVRSTNKNWHCYYDVPMTWTDVIEEMYRASADDMVAHEWIWAQIEREQNLVRPPHVIKPDELTLQAMLEYAKSHKHRRWVPPRLRTYPADQAVF